MGHYRSEMGFEDEDRRKEERAAKKRANLIEALEQRIASGDLAEVLAEVIYRLNSPYIDADSIKRMK